MLPIDWQCYQSYHSREVFVKIPISVASFSSFYFIVLLSYTFLYYDSSFEHLFSLDLIISSYVRIFVFALVPYRNHFAGLCFLKRYWSSFVMFSFVRSLVICSSSGYQSEKIQRRLWWFLPNISSYIFRYWYSRRRLRTTASRWRGSNFFFVYLFHTQLERSRVSVNFYLAFFFS